MYKSSLRKATFFPAFLSEEMILSSHSARVPSDRSPMGTSNFMDKSALLPVARIPSQKDMTHLRASPNGFNSFSKTTPIPRDGVKGKPYPQIISNKLQSLGYPSFLWATRKQIALVGVEILRSELDKGISCSELIKLQQHEASEETSSSEDFFENFTPSTTSTTLVEGEILYNASQTTNCKKIESLVGRLLPVDALNSLPIPSPVAEALTEAIEDYPKNEWISEEFFELGIQPREKARPLFITIDHSRTETLHPRSYHSYHDPSITNATYYNIADIKNQDRVEWIRKIYPCSASTFKPYIGAISSRLLTVALLRNYQSPLWITSNGAKWVNSEILNKDSGVTLAYPQNLVLYNIEETKDSVRVQKMLGVTKSPARSAFTGELYPGHVQKHLCVYQKRKKYAHSYWLTQRQASLLDVSLSGTPLSINMDNKEVQLYNVEQSSTPDLVLNRVEKLVKDKYLSQKRI